RTINNDVYGMNGIVDGAQDLTLGGIVDFTDLSHAISPRLFKNGTGTLTFSNEAFVDNTNAPQVVFITVNGGTLALAQDPLSGASHPNNTSMLLTIGDGIGVDTVRLFHSTELNFLTQRDVNVTINSSGLLDLNGNNDNITNLTLNGGSVATGT